MLLNFPGVPIDDRPKPVPRLAWIDQMRGLSMLWIILNHVVEPIFGSAPIGWPAKNWVPLTDRLALLQPLDVGAWSIPVNIIRYLGWLGDQGVSLFLILSGFGITWSILHRHKNRRLSVKSFLYHRLSAIYPMWLVSH
jgi:peptidoglycan/LPS O-acetylase OafA/YrhL